MSPVSYAVLVILGELLVYFIMGGILPFAAKGEQKSFAETVCAGYLVTTALFEGVALICVRQGMTLTVFSNLWAVILSICLAGSLVLNFPSVFRGTSVASGGIHFHFSVFLFIMAVIGFATMVVIMPSSGDPKQIIAQMTADLYYDTIGISIPGSGKRAIAIPVSVYLTRYSGFDLFICKLTGLHPMTAMKIVRTAVTCIVGCMAVYRVFYRLFDRDAVKASFAGILVCAGGLFFCTPFTPQGFLFSSGWTGDAAFGWVLIPVLLLIAISLYENPGNLRLVFLLILSGIAAVSLSTMSYVIWPAAMAAFVIPSAVAARKPVLLLAVPAAAIFPVTAMFLYLNLSLIPIG